MTRIRVNARFRGRPLTGVERFADEVVSRLAQRHDLSLDEAGPDKAPSGLKGHVWEQLLLPRRVGRDEILFSPCNTGPVAVRRQLVVIHDAAVWDCPEAFSRSFRTLYRQLLPRLAQRAAVVATVSEFSRHRLAPRLGISEESILVLGNGVDASFSAETIGGGEPAGGNGPLFLCVGSMDPRKNLGRLLRAWLSLQASGRLPGDARLQLVGGSNPRNFAGVDRVEGAGIEWLGRIDDAELIRRYRAADAFVFPSVYEGFGLPPLEAMSCGCPVLMSDAASLPEVGGEAFDPRRDGSEGAVLYFDPLSEAGIAAALGHFLALDVEQRRKIRANALARAREFTWEAVAARTAEALKEISA